MPVAVPCASCNTALEVDLEHVGWRVRCPKCDSVFIARSSAVSMPVEGGGAPSPYAQTWTPPAGWAGASASPPPVLSAAAPGAARAVDSPTPPTFPGAVPPGAAPVFQPSLAQPTGSFNEIFSPPLQPAPGATLYPKARNAFILGILAVAFLHFITGIPAVIVGYKARLKIRASGGQLAGDNLALAGIIMGALGILLTIADNWTPWSMFRIFRDTPRAHASPDEKPHK